MRKALTVGCWLWLLMGQLCYAQMLSPDLEIKRVTVGAAWQTIALENSYTEAVPVCTYNLTSSTNPPATTRIRNVTATSFEIRLQRFQNSSVVTASDVHCIIADVGAYNTGGLKFEARKVLSTATSGQAVGWGSTTTEDVSGLISQSYAAPVVLGQVMSFNDSKASVFWGHDCTARGNRPYQNGDICIGKHIGQIFGTRANETLGFIVIESSSGTINDVSFSAAVGSDSIAGVGNSPPYSYAVSGDYDTGVLTQAGEDGGQGGWAILYGADPLPNNQVRGAIDEETVAGDTSRYHTTEQVAYWLFDNSQSPTIAGEKTLAVYSGSVSDYSIPGSDVIYTITATNSGSGAVDNDTIFLVDSLPDEVSFYNSDIDDGGPETGPIAFVDTVSGLTLGPADIGYSSALSPPTNFAQCNFTPPGAGYQPAVRHICFAPKGAMSEGTITASGFSISFRARIN